MKITLAVILAVIATGALADQSVRGYTRKDGTYVQPHTQSSPNSSRMDNYSTQGNTNPYTGQAGTVNPYSQPSPNPYNTPNPYATPSPYSR